MEVVTMGKKMHVMKDKIVVESDRHDVRSVVEINVERNKAGDFRVHYKISYKDDANLKINLLEEFRKNISDQKFIKNFSAYLFDRQSIFDNKEKEDLCRETLILLRAAK